MPDIYYTITRIQENSTGGAGASVARETRVIVQSDALPAPTIPGALTVATAASGSPTEWTDLALTGATVSPDGGSIDNNDAVTITQSDGSATTVYTIDGTQPDVYSTRYSGTITLPVGTITLRVLSFRQGYTPAEVRKTFTVTQA